MEQQDLNITKSENDEEHERLTEEETAKRGALFEELSVENSLTEMESLCMNCHEQGVTRLLLTKIPFFKEIILMAFSCSHCGFRSNEVQYGGAFAEKGARYELSISEPNDTNRQIVKSDTASLLIPELEFEVPPNTQRGLLNTIEGFLTQSASELQSSQEERRKIDPEIAEKLDVFISKLEKCSRAEMPFTFIVDDPAGNSFIENPFAPDLDPKLKVIHYKRSPQQNAAIGLTSDETPEEQVLKQYEQNKSQNNNAMKGAQNSDLDLEKFDYKNEVMTFPGNCANCHSPCPTRMVVVDVPFFKEVVIMASACDECGYKSNEVKAGGAIPDKGKRIILKTTNPDDLSRNVLKSETAVVYIPEHHIEVGRGSLGGRFTTLEGLLNGIKEDIQVNPFIYGDSATSDVKERANHFMEKLDKLISGEENFTIVIEDPIGNSYIQNYYAPDPDPNMTVEDFDRTWEQNEELGLNDINTENYDKSEQESKQNDEKNEK